MGVEHLHVIPEPMQSWSMSWLVLTLALFLFFFLYIVFCCRMMLFFFRDNNAPRKAHILKLDMSGRFAVNIVDNLVIVHHQPSKVSHLYYWLIMCCTIHLVNINPRMILIFIIWHSYHVIESAVIVWEYNYILHPNLFNSPLDNWKLFYFNA